MRYYQFSPHVFVEVFSEAAVMLVADRHIMVKVNHDAAELFDHAQQEAGKSPFTRDDLLRFLLDHYDLSRTDAESQVRSLLGFSLRHGLIHSRMPA